VYAELLDEAGYTIVAVSDSKGGVYNADGLDIQRVKNTKEEHGSVTDTEEQRITNEELLELPVDVLGPAALEDVITEDNAENIQAQTIVELANGPVSSEADTILKNKDVDVIPDILANSGGVIVSYYEWVQNKTGDQWTAEEVDTRLKTKILKNYEAVKTQLSGTYRETAYRIATKRILEAATLRGKL
jgi:glutamate dehydrogenase/leucine dehydrogenase